MLIARDEFKKQAEKQQMTPFFPLLSFPNRDHKLYDLCHLQSRTHIECKPLYDSNAQLKGLKRKSTIREIKKSDKKEAQGLSPY